LLKPSQRDTDRSTYPLNGLCYFLAEALYRLAPERFTSWRISWGEGRIHWFLKDHDGAIIDMVSHGYPKPLCTRKEYARGEPQPFLSRGSISRPARVLIEPAGLALPAPARTQKGA
jgi:hypothetical protein